MESSCPAAIWPEYVDLAKAEALRLIGEQEQGYALVGRHVWPGDA